MFAMFLIGFGNVSPYCLQCCRNQVRLRLGNASKIVCNLFYGYDVYHVLCIFSNYRISDQFFHIFLQSAKDERSLFVGAVALCLHAWHNQVVEKAKQENNLISVTWANHNEVVLEKNNPLRELS